MVSGTSGAPMPQAQARVVGLAEAVRFAQEARARGERVALTNGCFDLVHPGHVALLEQARACAEVLIVGVNADAGVRTLKGPGRPLVPQEDRAAVVAALRPVDRVVVFDELDASALVEAIRPDVYVKGADYALEDLPERQAVERVGARLVLVPVVPGRSTTALVRRIRGGPA